MSGWSEAASADFEAAGQQVTAIRMSTQLGISTSKLYSMLRGERPFSMAYLERWATETGAHHLMLWCGRVTGHLVARAPQPGESIADDLPGLLCEFADLVEALNAAMADGRITQAEFEQVRQEGQELIGAVMRIIEATRLQIRVHPLRPATMAEAEHFGRGA